MSFIQGKIKKSTKSNIEFEDNQKIESLDVTNKRVWIRITNSKYEVAIRYIKSIDKTAKKIEFDSELPFLPLWYKTFDIDIGEKTGTKITTKKDSTKKTINLVDTAKKIDNVYKGYWVLFKDQVREVKEYKDNIITLDYDLITVPAENEEIQLLPHFFNDYIILGIDFTNLFGMDFSSLIDSVGGIFKFQIGSAALCCCCCCILLISMVLMMTGKKTGKVGKGGGLYIPGLGQMGTQQPLIIQMPMQTKPYPYNDSPFPRDT